MNPRDEIKYSLPRRKTRPVYIGKVKIGDGSAISVQSMTKTFTVNVAETVRQIEELAKAGCEIVRVGVPDIESARAIASIKKEVDIPIVADIHFDHILALE
ncbi:MAG: flavodoxin-dependent (E)-4-hydroxy-3-methylbut-2-enyl-diphosphate synthase, partial [Candidatus Sumerlaeia bacterium]|nr:flavodoxin-dependent (E)-4-hydroxy-3-methylbut-2-enyl-diphosphate synthase [Candidatus Sumerlaeia bacterium]